MIEPFPIDEFLSFLLLRSHLFGRQLHYQWWIIFNYQTIELKVKAKPNISENVFIISIIYNFIFNCFCPLQNWKHSRTANNNPSIELSKPKNQWKAIWNFVRKLEEIFHKKKLSWVITSDHYLWIQLVYLIFYGCKWCMFFWHLYHYH